VVASTPNRSMSTQNIVALSVGASGLIALATGAGFGISAAGLAADYRNAIGSNAAIDGLRQNSDDRASTANILYAAGGSLLATGAVLWLFENLY